MTNKTDVHTFWAARSVATLFGILAGVGGITHGVGEVLQGNVAATGLVVDSWVQGPIATRMDGEPAVTLVPNMLVTGILALLVSLAIIVWSTRFVRGKEGGRGLLFLSVLLLAVGGGVGPPLIGLLAGVAGSGVHAAGAGWRSRLPAGSRRFLAGVWPFLFAFTAATAFFLVIGSLILITFFDVDNAALFLNTFYLALLSLLLTVVLAPIYDHRPAGQPGLAYE